MKNKLMILVLVIMLAGLVVNTGCKKSNKFDITGYWIVESTLEGMVFSEGYTFTGDKSGGDILYNGQQLGTYSVSGDTINFTLEYYDQDDDYTVEVYTGTVDGDDQFSGNFSYSVEGYQTLTGIYVATR